jgi:hypothetical protein
MRRIFDPPELVQQLESTTAVKDRADHKALLKESRVRRSDQGRGAMEPDLVIRDCSCWMELKDAKDPEPQAKLLQAESDALEARQGQWPVAITHKIGRRSIQVTMRCYVFLEHVAEWMSGLDVITIDYSDFLDVLSEKEKARAK